MPSRPLIIPLHNGPSRLVLDDFSDRPNDLRRARMDPPPLQRRCQAKLRPRHYSKGRLHPLVEDELPQCPFNAMQIHYPGTPDEGTPDEDILCPDHAEELHRKCSAVCRWKIR